VGLYGSDRPFSDRRQNVTVQRIVPLPRMIRRFPGPLMSGDVLFRRMGEGNGRAARPLGVSRLSGLMPSRSNRRSSVAFSRLRQAHQGIGAEPHFPRPASKGEPKIPGSGTFRADLEPEVSVVRVFAGSAVLTFATVNRLPTCAAPPRHF
jgi:hypothetical protein